MAPAWGHLWVARSGPCAQSQEQIQLLETEDRAAACGPLAQSCLLLPAPSLLLGQLFSMMLWEEEGCKMDSPQLVPALHPLIFFYTAVWLNHA